MDTGIIMVYQGDARYIEAPPLGQVFRAIGRNLKSRIFDFQGDLAFAVDSPMLKPFGDLVAIRSGDSDPMGVWIAVQEALQSSEPVLVWLSGIDKLIEDAIANEETLLEAVRGKAPHVNVIMTAERAPQSILAVADLITEVTDMKAS